MSLECALAADKRRSIAYCIESTDGAVLRVMAKSEDLKAQAESTSESNEHSNTELDRLAFVALKWQHRSHYSSVDDNPFDVSIKRNLTASFDHEAESVKQELEMRPNWRKAKLQFQFFRRSEKKHRNALVALPSQPTKLASESAIKCEV